MSKTSIVSTGLKSAEKYFALPFNTVFHIIANFFPDWVKLIGYLASAVNVISCNFGLVLLQELRYFYFYYEYAQMSSYQFQK